MSTVTVHVYGKSAQVNPDNPAFSFHTGNVLPYITVFANIKSEGRLWREEFKVTSLEVAEEQIQEVIQFFNGTLHGGETPRKFHSLYEEDEEVANYHDDIGMSGWLNPEGAFFPCGFGEHVRYALDLIEYSKLVSNKDMDELSENQHISMSMWEQSSGSYMNILGKLTEPQVEWFNRFFYKLTPAQRTSVSHKACEQNIKLKYHW